MFYRSERLSFAIIHRGVQTELPLSRYGPFAFSHLEKWLNFSFFFPSPPAGFRGAYTNRFPAVRNSRISFTTPRTRSSAEFDAIKVENLTVHSKTNRSEVPRTSAAIIIHCPSRTGLMLMNRKLKGELQGRLAAAVHLPSAGRLVRVLGERNIKSGTFNQETPTIIKRNLAAVFAGRAVAGREIGAIPPIGNLTNR